MSFGGIGVLNEGRLGHHGGLDAVPWRAEAAEAGAPGARPRPPTARRPASLSPAGYAARRWSGPTPANVAGAASAVGRPAVAQLGGTEQARQRR